MKYFIYILIFIIISCELPDNKTEYQEGLVVFGRIELFEVGGLTYGNIDTVRVSLSSQIDANIDNANQLYIDDANVTITGPFDQDENIIRTISLNPINDLGKYIIDGNEEYEIWPNSNYILNVTYQDYTVSGATTTPNYLTIESIEDTYNCEQCSDPTIYGQNTCENSGENWTSELQNIELINVDNFNLINDDTNGLWSVNPDLLQSYIDQDIISSIALSRYGCSVGSFASKPYFVLDIDDQEEEDNPNLSAIRILSYALEEKYMGLEPSNDNGTFFDYNQNEIQDMTLINTFYDTTAVFNIWKGPYFRDDNYNPYLLNPFVWTIETSPSPIMWLYFNYYGKHLIVVQASDDAYYDYLSGDPLSQNQYLLPDSNIEGGYGLFTSNYSKAFFLNIIKAD
tara:strand:- start:21 stop:1214 length:1194 start_codon:yes stop_codon:yes gene_type:complete